MRLRSLSCFWICLTALLLFSARVQAEPLPPLPVEERAAWAAIGRVNGAGIGKLQGCTGTLIAPDLVLTAAHCTGATATVPNERHFVAGWDRGEFVAHRVSVETLVHPAYGLAGEQERFRYDVALLRLETPIPGSVLSPLPMLTQPLHSNTVGLVGYHNRRPHVLNARFDCPALPPFDAPLVRISCEVISGNSGGPLLVETEEGWAVGGVLVARGGPAGFGLAVPLSDWVMDHWRAAMKRAGS